MAEKIGPTTRRQAARAGTAEQRKALGFFVRNVVTPSQATTPSVTKGPLFRANQTSTKKIARAMHCGKYSFPPLICPLTSTARMPDRRTQQENRVSFWIFIA